MDRRGTSWPELERKSPRNQRCWTLQPTKREQNQKTNQLKQVPRAQALITWNGPTCLDTCDVSHPRAVTELAIDFEIPNACAGVLISRQHLKGCHGCFLRSWKNKYGAHGAQNKTPSSSHMPVAVSKSGNHSAMGALDQPSRLSHTCHAKNCFGSPQGHAPRTQSARANSVPKSQAPPSA